MIDIQTFLITRDNAAGPVVRIIEDPVTIEPTRDANGNVTRSSMIAYLVTYGVAFCIVSGFILFT